MLLRVIRYHPCREDPMTSLNVWLRSTQARSGHLLWRCGNVAVRVSSAKFFITAVLLNGPLNRWNATQCLWYLLDRDRSLSAIGNVILALSCIHVQVGSLNRLILNRLGGSTARHLLLSVWNPLKTRPRQKLDGGRNSRAPSRPRLNPEPQGATKSCQWE